MAENMDVDYSYDKHYVHLTGKIPKHNQSRKRLPGQVLPAPRTGNAHKRKKFPGEIVSKGSSSQVRRKKSRRKDHRSIKYTGNPSTDRKGLLKATADQSMSQKTSIGVHHQSRKPIFDRRLQVEKKGSRGQMTTASYRTYTCSSYPNQDSDVQRLVTVPDGHCSPHDPFPRQVASEASAIVAPENSEFVLNRAESVIKTESGQWKATVGMMLDCDYLHCSYPIPTCLPVSVFMVEHATALSCYLSSECDNTFLSPRAKGPILLDGRFSEYLRKDLNNVLSDLFTLSRTDDVKEDEYLAEATTLLQPILSKLQRDNFRVAGEYELEAVRMTAFNGVCTDPQFASCVRAKSLSSLDSPSVDLILRFRSDFLERLLHSAIGLGAVVYVPHPASEERGRFVCPSLLQKTFADGKPEAQKPAPVIEEYDI